MPGLFNDGADAFFLISSFTGYETWFSCSQLGASEALEPWKLARERRQSSCLWHRPLGLPTTGVYRHFFEFSREHDWDIAWLVAVETEHKQLICATHDSYNFTSTFWAVWLMVVQVYLRQCCFMPQFSTLFRGLLNQ